MKNILTLLIVIVALSCEIVDPHSLSSPDNSVKIAFVNSGEEIKIDVLYLGDTIIKQSPLGLSVENLPVNDGIIINSWHKSIKDTSWVSVNGKNKHIRNHYQELDLEIASSSDNRVLYNIIIRCYNDGFAYRYKFSQGDNLSGIKIKSENTHINFTQDLVWWSYNGENHNIGPEKLSESQEREIRIPMVSKLSESAYLAIHEAEIIWNAPFGIKIDKEGKGLQFSILPTEESGDYQTSWRTFILGHNPGSLVESNLLVNLNEPCKIPNTDWIKPGKAMWDWRVWGYETQDGFTYGLNTESHKRFIDFASENNIQYLLIDADWYGAEFSEDSDPTSSREGVNIVECMEYAEKKNVGVILYLNDVGAKRFGLERVLKQFADWGAAGVKYGFMRGSEEQKVRHTREVVELCAKYQLMVNFHDNPIPPSGDRRTWPNLMTKEFGHSQADAKRSYYPETAVTAPFVNQIAGPLDMCEGWFGLSEAESRVKVFQVIPGTVAAEVAKLIVNYSGWKILPDCPEEYLKKDDLFECIRQMPPQFDSYKVLDGTIGEHISVARASGSDWFVGSLTNRSPRKLSISLDFLDSGSSYEASIFADTESTHFLNEKESYQIKTMKVNANSVIEAQLAPGGGHSILIKKI